MQQTRLLLAEKIADLREKIIRLTKQLTEHQALLAGMKQKAEAFLDENRVNSTHWVNSPVGVRDEDVEVAFLYEKQKWSES